jgi:hypothetical protein
VAHSTEIFTSRNATQTLCPWELGSGAYVCRGTSNTDTAMFGVGGKDSVVKRRRSGMDDVVAGASQDAPKRIVADSTAMAGFVY